MDLKSRQQLQRRSKRQLSCSDSQHITLSLLLFCSPTHVYVPCVGDLKFQTYSGVALVGDAYSKKTNS